MGELRHHDGISPAWPIRYEDLEPYYTQAEHLYLVRGRHGEDPTAGPTSAQYAYPPVAHEPRIQQLSDDLGKAGLHPFHLPIGVNLTQDENGGAAHDSVCIRCDRVDGFPCLVGAKSDAQVLCVDPALEYDNDCGGCSGTWACTSTTCCRTASTCTRACPSPTTSTTSTSWTPASSRASGR